MKVLLIDSRGQKLFLVMKVNFGTFLGAISNLIWVPLTPTEHFQFRIDPRKVPKFTFITRKSFWPLESIKRTPIYQESG